MTSPPSVESGSLLLGAQHPRVRHVPDYVSSAGQEAIELAALAGLNLDPWQQAVLIDALGEREDGKWSAFEVGLVVPRQNGKGSILEARELAGLFLFGENLLIHSAHEQATSSEHFRRLLQLIESVPEFERRVMRAPKGKGAEAIELKGGQRILFKTRTGGGGRGLTGDFVALDEAMILPVATTGALVPTMAAKSITGNPQLWYSGSAVDATVHEHGLVLSRVRDRGLKGSSRLAYFEWSAEGDRPEDLSIDARTDSEAWAQANPGMGIRISEEHIGNECAGALGPREFAVERLGVGDWPALTDTAAGAGLDNWLELADEDSAIVDPVWLALDVSPSRSASAISAGGGRDDGLSHVEIIDHRPGTGWLVDRLLGLKDAHRIAGVVLDQAGPAMALAPALEQAGITVRTVTTAEYAQACAVIFDAVAQRSVRHLGQPELDAAVNAASRRQLGDAWAWSRKKSSGDITPLVSATLALWAAKALKSRKKPSFEVIA